MKVLFTEFLRLAQNFHGGTARFLLELIRNADACNYSRAKALGVEPSIKFTVHPNTIVIEVNDDGFTAEDVWAICRIGERTETKPNSYHYLDEKGIWFKSVFMMVSKVHIQSGPFSFSFKHGPGDHGMGMITPTWEPSNIVLEGPLTRITLTLLDSLDFHDLLSTLVGVPPTLLLFLKNLGNIIIVSHAQLGKNEQVMEPSAGPGPCTSYCCVIRRSIGGAAVGVSVGGIGDIKSCLNQYRIARKSIYNLPTSGQRTYNNAEVILAFPVVVADGVEQPGPAPEQFSAYLPIRHYGFPVRAPDGCIDQRVDFE